MLQTLTLSQVIFKGFCNNYIRITSFCRTTTFVEHHSKAASVRGIFGKILRQTSGIIIKVPSFIVEVRILSGTLFSYEIYLEQLPVKIYFNSCFSLHLLVQALNAIFV